MCSYNKHLKKVTLSFIGIILIISLLSGCNEPLNDPLNDPLNVPSNRSDLKFDISNAKAVAGYSASAAKELGGKSIGSRAFIPAQLVKIDEDNVIKDAIQFPENNNWTPDVSFISIGSDKSVYVCFSQPYTQWSYDQTTGNSSVSIQFVRVFPDNHYDILWPLNPLNYNQMTDGYVNTWSWQGMDNDPLQKGDDGQLYFKVTSNSGGSNNDAIYSYDPALATKPNLRTPANASLSIQSFKVDSKRHLFIKSQNNGSGSSSYLRYYTQGVTSPVNIYYVSSGNDGVRGYNTTSEGNSVLISGENIGSGISGIIRANLQENNALPTYDILYSTTYNNSNYINLNQYSGNDNPTAIVKYNNTTYKYEWDNSVLTEGNLDKNKLLLHVGFYYLDIPSLENLKFQELKAIDLGKQSNYSLLNSDNTKLELSNYRFGDIIAGSGEQFLRSYFTGTLLKDWMLENNLSNFNILNVNTIIEGGDKTLYGLYGGGSYYYGSNNPNMMILKLLDSAGNNSLSVIKINHSTDKPSKIKIVGDYLYYRYAVMNGTMETGYHKLARIHLKENTEQELLTDSYLITRNLELQTYDISSDEKVMYVSALDYDTNEVIFGEIDLLTKVFTRIDAESRFNTVRTF